MNLSRSTLELCQRVLIQTPTGEFLDPETHQMAPVPALAFAELHAALQEPTLTGSNNVLSGGQADGPAE